MTHVMFRKWRNGDVIAMFPYEPGTNDPWTCMSYEHVGQHGSASSDLSPYTSPAKATEYSALKHELESIGYKLVVLNRMPNQRAAKDVRAAKIARIA